MGSLRVGYGYDIHRLVPGRRLLLAGVEFPGPLGLFGHSDADVVCHALIDAILGALALGDIGLHFPATDDKWKNANSLELLERVWAKAGQAGARLVNADVTVVAERPRLGPHLDAMRGNLARRLGADRAQISIKATTNEGLGPEGRGEGISAVAVCLLEVG